MTLPRLLSFAPLCLLLCAESFAFLVPTVSSTHQRGVGQNAASLSFASRTCKWSPPPTSSSSLGATSSFRNSIPVIRRQIMEIATSFATLLVKEFQDLSRFQKGLLAATFVTGFLVGKCKPFWKRYTSVMDIPPSMFGKVLRGRAITVSDGDTLRFLHAPTLFSPTSLRNGEKASEIALPIRVCTIDTPETPKFGKAGQPYGTEAKEHLKNLVESKRVNVRLLQKDQYGRAVGEVFTGRLFVKKHVDRQMLQAGLAEVYQGGGAVYGPLGKKRYLEIEEDAKEKKVGIWSQTNRESAAEYKKRTK